MLFDDIGDRSRRCACWRYSRLSKRSRSRECGRRDMAFGLVVDEVAFRDERSYAELTDDVGGRAMSRPRDDNVLK